MANYINEELFLIQLRDKMNAEMTRAAEPLVQKAIHEAEVAIRKRVAEMVVGLIEKSYSVERCGSILNIRVELGKTAKSED